MKVDAANILCMIMGCLDRIDKLGRERETLGLIFKKIPHFRCVTFPLEIIMLYHKGCKAKCTTALSLMSLFILSCCFL